MQDQGQLFKADYGNLTEASGSLFPTMYWKSLKLEATAD